MSTSIEPFDASAPDAFALLADTHDDLRRRLDALAQPSWQAPAGRRALVDAGLWLNIHAALAIALVYPAVREAGAADLGVERAEAGLLDVLRALEDLLAADAAGAECAARLDALRRQADSQFADEEVALFTQLATGTLDVDELGRAFVERRRALLDELGMALH